MIMIMIMIPKWCCHHGRAIATVHLVHLMNVKRRQLAVSYSCRPKTKPDNLPLQYDTIRYDIVY